MHFACEQDSIPADREVVFGVAHFPEEDQPGKWKSFLPLRMLIVPTVNGNMGQHDLKVGVRNPVLRSATFEKTLARFLEIIDEESR